jgi:hypothetical protein
VLHRFEVPRQAGSPGHQPLLDLGNLVLEGHTSE